MVPARLLPSVLVLAVTLGVQAARADVYTWVDASGRMHVSNLSPPEGARITSVVVSLPKSAAQEEAAREAVRRAEIQALNDRVARLQDELERSRREAPPPIVYATPPVMAYPPPPPQYANWTPPAVPYVVDAAPQPMAGCDYLWNNCGAWWGGWPYATTVVVSGGKNFHRGRPIHGARPVGQRPPAWIRTPAPSRRG